MSMSSGSMPSPPTIDIGISDPDVNPTRHRNASNASTLNNNKQAMSLSARMYAGSYRGSTTASTLVGSKYSGRQIPILVAPRQEPTCKDHLRSVKVLLPSMVGIIVCVMAAVTITLLVLNSNSAVNDVANLLHNQVQAVVESRVLSHLDQVLSVNTASAKTINARPLGPPPASNQTPVNDAWLTQHLDSVVNAYSLVDGNFVFYRNGRVVNVLTNDDTTNFYAEEFYPDGAYFWTFPKGNTSAIVTNRSNPAITIPDYKGSTRSYFIDASRTTAYDYAWTNPYKVGPLLLFTNTVSMIDDTGVFQGVMGANSYITTLTEFFTTLRPTPRTKLFLSDPTGLLVIATHGSVLTTAGAQILAINSDDSTVAISARAMGSFGAIPTNIQRTKVDDGDTWLLSYRRLEILRAVLIVGVSTPEVEFLGSVETATNRTIGICVAIAVVGLVLVTIVCVVISHALDRLERQLDRVAHLDFEDDDVENEVVDDGTSSQRSSGSSIIKGRSMFSELRRTEESYLKLRAALGAFRRYVPLSVVHGVLGGDILPFTAMSPCQVAVTFHDIVGFTSMCELHEQNLVVQLVSDMFESMTKIIDRHNGTIDKFIGDAIMSYWEVGKPGTTTATEACESCAKVLLQTYSTSIEGPDDEMITFRAGGHFGEALIGNFGSSTRFSYTVVGDTVNSAARLEPLNKQLKTKIIISNSLHNSVHSEDLLRHIVYVGRIVLVGKVDVTEVFTVLPSPLSKDAASVWSDTVSQFDQGEYAAAKDRLINGPQKLLDSPMAQELITVIDAYLWQAPPERLRGVRQQEGK